ncbi:hypothetical protein VTO73DRAFT_4375 [Trametes versicolor]
MQAQHGGPMVTEPDPRSPSRPHALAKGPRRPEPFSRTAGQHGASAGGDLSTSLQSPATGSPRALRLPDAGGLLAAHSARQGRRLSEGSLSRLTPAPFTSDRRAGQACGPSDCVPPVDRRDDHARPMPVGKVGTALCGAGL